MEATGKRQERARKSIDRWLGLLCAVLLLGLASGCRSEGPAATASQESDTTAEMAGETSGDTLARLGGDVEQRMPAPEGAAGELETTDPETGVE